jgi:hypothetical protein
MTAYEKQIHETEAFYDTEIHKVEQQVEREGGEILSSVVPGSQLHEKINNPVTEGIDEG